MFKKGVVNIIILLSLVVSAKAGITDTIIAIDEVVAKGVKFNRHTFGSRIVSIDTFHLSVNQMSSVADLFSQHGLVNVTTYGPGGMAGVSMRGGSSDHTTIVWNGLNIKPPMSGELNYSAFSSGVIDEIEICPGGSSTMYGSGAATGVIMLSNKIDFEKKGLSGEAGAEIGSFGSYGVNGEASYSSKKFGTRIVGSYKQGENNFPYKYGNKERIQEHAANRSISLVQQNLYKFSANTKIETDLMLSGHFRQIPSLITNNEPGRAEQRDNNLHLAVNFTHFGSNWFIKYRGGGFLYYNHYLGYYTAEQEYYTSLNRSQTLINEVESKYSINRTNKLFFGLNQTMHYVPSDTYSEYATRNLFDLFGRYSSSLANDKLQFNFEGRQAIADGNTIPFVYSIGAHYSIVESLSIKALGKRLYSLPDLNDLYWGETAWSYGNRDLKPEYGWSAEGGVEHKYNLSILDLSHEFSVYRTELTDAIIWLPDSTNRWTPINVSNSSVKGFEFTGNTAVLLNKSKLVLGYDYAYTDATIDREGQEGKPRVQRRYMPKHKAALRIQYLIDKLSLALYSQYNSERYIDPTSLPLEPYVLIDFYANYSFKFKESGMNVYLKVKNILNTDYQVMSGFAQPGIAYYIGINYKFK